ncbi:MAG: M28 family peptidase [Acidobacteria bacterium]|nr:MAG: M28 family peptidase [Acidobacteriota bacterium]
MRRHSAVKLSSLIFLFSLLLIFLAHGWKAMAADTNVFNGGRAFADLQHLVSYGPRPVGSKALDASRAWIISQLEHSRCKVVQDNFVGATPMGNIPMVNLIGEIPGKEPKRIIMIAGHYDTKLENSFRFVGANDGGSSAAFLLEMARELAQAPHTPTYWIVFFDGEEALQTWSETDSLYGSRHFVQKLTADGELSRIEAMILVDMIGDAHLDIHWDQNSTGWLNKLVFGQADKLGYSSYFLRQPVAIDDDHVPFVGAGVSAVDLIDFDYGPNNSYWHSAQDMVEHCSPSSLTIVGRVVKAALSQLESSPRTQ